MSSNTPRRPSPARLSPPRRTFALGLATASLFAPATAQAVATPALDRAEAVDPRLINVKFRDDTAVAVDGARLSIANAATQRRLDPLLGADRAKIAPVFEAPAAKLDSQRLTLQAKGKDLADLTTWFSARLAPDVDPKATIAQLRADPLVEYAYVIPKGQDTTLTTTQQTRLNTYADRYLGSGPAGLNIWASKDIEGALGTNVDIVDVERNVNPSHEDLLRSPVSVDKLWEVPSGLTPEESDPAHGTMVAGAIAAKRDGVGVNGVAPNARVHLASNWGTIPAVSGTPTGSNAYANAIYAGGDRLAPGSIILIEQEYPTVGALEIDPTVLAAIKWAVANGIIVVEPAGNYSYDYNSAAYEGSSLHPTGENSGAIVVGAGGVGCTASPDHGARVRLGFSGYGTRVDVQGPGECVATTTTLVGYGQNADNAYDVLFNGTSSASAVVAGVLAGLSGAYEAKVGIPLTPALARQTLKSTGKAQDTTVVSGQIGPLPDMFAALSAIAKPDTTEPTQPTTSTTPPSNTGTTATFSWGASTDDIGVTHYDILRNGVPYDQTTSKSYVDQRTSPSTSYNYSVVAVDRAGNESQYHVISLTTSAATAPTDTIAPGAPGATSAAPDEDLPRTKVNLTWAAATDNVGVARYQVRRNGILIGTTSTTSFSDATLSPGRYNSYSIVAFDAAGNRSTPGPVASVLTAGPRADIVPPALTASPAGLPNGNLATLTWSPATDAVGVASYEVWRTTNLSTPFVKIDQTVVPNYVDTGLAPSTTYYYKVHAVDAAGNRSSPSATNLTTAAFTPSTDTVKPTAPGASSPSLSANKPVVGWTAGTDNVGVTRYQLRKNGLYAGTTSGLTYTDNGSRPGRYATYGVVALDAAGNRSGQNASSGIAPVPAP